MKTIHKVLAAAAFAGLTASTTTAHALAQGGTTFACTSGCTASGTVTSTRPVQAVYPFFYFRCLDGRVDYMSAEVPLKPAGPVVAGVYNYTWSITRYPRYSCAGVAELTVYFASDNFLLDTRAAPFDSRL